MASTDVSETVTAVRSEVINKGIDNFIAPQSLDEQWDIPGLEKHLEGEFGLQLPVQQWLDTDDSLHEESLRDKIEQQIVEDYQAKEAMVGPDNMRTFEKQVMLQVLDTLWKEHLQAMDLLRQGIHLRGYAQKNPKQEYKRESFILFEQLLENIKTDVVKILSNVQIRQPEEIEAMERQRREQAERQQMDFKHDAESAMGNGAEGEGEAGAEPVAETFVRDEKKVGRNEPCPCGSGKKYKQCHGKLN